MVLVGEGSHSSHFFDHYYWKTGVAKIQALVTRVELNLIG